MGMTIYDPRDLYWVYSRQGPAHTGINHGRLFVDGHLPAPVAGDDAQVWISRGYVAQKWDGESWWVGWRKSELGQWSPTMGAIMPLTEVHDSASTVKRRRKVTALG